MNCAFLIFRVGRTARGEGGKGHALLILRPEEYGFLRYLKQAKVPLNEFEFSWSKISDIQPQLEKLVSKNYFLNLSAKEAFKAYVRSYESHSLKQVLKFRSQSFTSFMTDLCQDMSSRHQSLKYENGF